VQFVLVFYKMTTKWITSLLAWKEAVNIASTVINIQITNALLAKRLFATVASLAMSVVFSRNIQFLCALSWWHAARGATEFLMVILWSVQLRMCFVAKNYKNCFEGVWGKGKVVPVILTEHHAMKAYWGSEGIAPRILWSRQ
jgi:hypothetical protein